MLGLQDTLAMSVDSRCSKLTPHHVCLLIADFAVEVVLNGTLCTKAIALQAVVRIDATFNLGAAVSQSVSSCVS